MMSDSVHSRKTIEIDGHPLFTVLCSHSGKWSIPTPSIPPTKEFGKFVGQLQASKVHLPNPGKFNAQVIPQNAFRSVQKLSDTTLAWAPNQPADGTLLGPNEAGLYTAAGCPIIIATCGDRMGFAHAGQRCLFDTARILGQPHVRDPSSVVGALLEAVDPERKNRQAVHVWVFWSISMQYLSYEIEHEVHSSFNKALAQHLTDLGYDEGGYRRPWGRTATHIHLDLPRIIKIQAVTCGVPQRKIRIGEFSYLPPDLPTTRTAPGHNYIVAVVRH